MKDFLEYEEFGEINRTAPLEAFYEAMLPQFENYGLTAKFPADKPSLAESINGIEHDVLIGDLPNAVCYLKWQGSPYTNGGFELTLESETLVHRKTNDKLAFKIFISDYIRGMKHESGNFSLILKFRGEQSEVEALQKSIAPVLEKYNFQSHEVKKSQVITDNLEEISNKNSNSELMTNNVNFDELAAKAFAPTAGESDFENLFAAVFSLDAWFFIADAEFQYKMFYCAPFKMFDDATALTVFTDGERARRFITEGGLKGGAAVETRAPEDLIMRISTDGILDFFDNLAPFNIAKIFFNPDKNSHGFHHDLKMMRPIYEHLQGKNLLTKNEAEKVETPIESQPKAEISNETDFDALSKKAMETNAMEDLNALFGAAFALEKWNFISRGELPNVSPYIASNPAAAGNQPMIRAFTDTERLMRFARENNLTDADGSANILTIPTENIIPYLEGFAEHGAFGVWFNSDSQSKDFFIPIKQLQPIKDHLGKTKPKAETKFTALILTITDGLSLPSGFVKQSTYNCNFFCWLPRDWTADFQLKPEYLEKLYEQFYGVSWRSGNSDGSRYVVSEANSAVISPERVQTTKWNLVENSEFNRYWFYVGEENGTFKKVSADEFQANFDAYFQTENTNEAQKRQDNLADFGFRESPDGGIEQNLFIGDSPVYIAKNPVIAQKIEDTIDTEITINKIGTVNFETSIAPFYEAIVPLLQNYKGVGDFVTLLRFEEIGKSEQVENIAENSHGAYLQIRRFLYLNPKNNVRIGVNSIHSNRLMHNQTNSELLVSIELCKNLDNQTAVFYHAFQGASSEVSKLSAAIQPILEASGYQAVQ